MKPALIFIITTIAQLYLFVMLLRFWLPFLRADFRNPISQGILRLTSPLIVPVRSSSKSIPEVTPSVTTTGVPVVTTHSVQQGISS